MECARNSEGQSRPESEYQQQEQQMDQELQLQSDQMMGISIGEGSAEPEVVLNLIDQQSSSMASTNSHRQALEQLMELLRTPNSPEQQNEILRVLRSNPELMAAFIRQRQQQARRRRRRRRRGGRRI